MHSAAFFWQMKMCLGFYIFAIDFCKSNYTSFFEFVKFNAVFSPFILRRFVQLYPCDFVQTTVFLFNSDIFLQELYKNVQLFA